MITSCKKHGDNKYIINDSVIIYDITMEEDIIEYEISYDSISEEEAIAIAEEFISDVLRSAVDKPQR